eukprot:365625-Chlamydomonas_euryale.AAC.19
MTHPAHDAFVRAVNVASSSDGGRPPKVSHTMDTAMPNTHGLFTGRRRGRPKSRSRTIHKAAPAARLHAGPRQWSPGNGAARSQAEPGQWSWGMDSGWLLPYAFARMPERYRVSHLGPAC